MKLPQQDVEKRVGVAGCKHTTRDFIRRLADEGYVIDHLITISPDKGESQKVAGYEDLRPFADEMGILYTIVDRYSMKFKQSEQEKKEEVLALNLDMLFVIGWQRLIPEWFLDRLSLGAFGMHGSSEPLPRGRGRSPMNWSILEDRTSFMTHLFKYDPGVDSGAIVAMQKFDIYPWDDANTLHMKNRIAMTKLVMRHIADIMTGRVVYTRQRLELGANHYRRRNEEDGRVVWDDLHMKDLHNHIRCQNRPFPGAFSHLNGEDDRFYFWQSHPFDSHILYYGKLPGTVVETFYDGSFLVATWDGSVRVYDYTSPFGEPPAIGDRFHNRPLSQPDLNLEKKPARE